MSKVSPLPKCGRLNVTLGTLVSDAFSSSGPLARSLPLFEPRPSQREMAAAAGDIFTDGGVLLAEAGTGTGKTLAYLVPAILSRNRVLISTGTKNLQDQIYYKDLPTLREALGVPFTATYMKGRGNYLCLHRFDALRQSDEPRTSVNRTYLNQLEEWATQTETGDRSEIEDLPDDLPLWNEISATSENCIGMECPSYENCFITRMRRQALESDLVIVNHHLLCADAAVRQSAYGEVIPSCAYTVIDEAHQLEDVATQYFGISISNYRLDELVRDARRLLSAENMVNWEGLNEAKHCVDETQDRALVFCKSLALIAATGDRTRVNAETLGPVAETARRLMDSLSEMKTLFSGFHESSEDLLAIAQRAGELREQLLFLLDASNTDFVYFLELRGKGVFLRGSPIDVSTIINELLLQRATGTILTSATLTVDDTFDYVRERLGIEQAFELRLPSEFDFSEQTVLFLPQRMPDPRSDKFAPAVAKELMGLLQVTKGRAFVLFTSYANLREVHRQLDQKLPYPLLVQGSAPRTVLLREFRSTPEAVLLATSSFWQGVDVAGDSLSCVVIDKLPFASPSDPITAARMETVEAKGGNAFTDYQVPLAVLALLQGLGRLIRHRRDRGVLALFDGRIQTKGYGQRFLASLPPAPVIHELSEVQEFFNRKSVTPATANTPVTRGKNCQP